MTNIEEALSLKHELDNLRPLSKEQEDTIMQKFRLDWNYNSNNLEGNSLTYGETKALLLHGITAQGKPLKDHVTITRLYELADIFGCTPEYILSFQHKPTGITNYFNNYDGNNGVNIMYQGYSSDELKNLEEQVEHSKRQASRVQAKIQTRNN